MNSAIKSLFSVLKKSKLGLTGAALFTLAATMPAAAQTVQRPIEDFIDAQGTASFFFPPVPDLLAWIPELTPPDGTIPQGEPFLFALVDYAGKFNEYLIDQGSPSLGTTIDGTVKERLLKDEDENDSTEEVEVTVNLRTKNALTSAFSVSDIPLFFGTSANEILDGSTNNIALGDSHLRVVFKYKRPVEDKSLPNLVCINYPPEEPQLPQCPEGFELKSLQFHATACGLSSMDPDRQQLFVAKLKIDQNALFATPGKGRALQDSFPVERVEVKQLGPGASCKP